MSRQALLNLVRDRLGLDPASLGERVLDDACAEARRDLGVASDDALYRRVAVDADAFADCSEHFVVPESWFFRAAEQYDDLVRFAREQQQRERRPLRVLSLPCAAGEEAYSAVIALLDAGLAPSDIDVLGIDVSHLAIRRAQAGVYRSSSLRGRTPVPHWMEATRDGFILDATVRRCARFRQGNALDPQLLRAEDLFDVVFCRNLLIYLHPDARAQLLNTLLAALQTPGLILAGQAEVLTSMSQLLQPYERGCPLSFVRRERGETAEPSRHVRRPTAAPAAAARAKAARTSLATAVSIEATPAPPTVTPGPLVVAQRLADGGHLDQARQICLHQLKQTPVDVGALYLLGLLESAEGNTDAADRAFTRVLYLDREHLDALEQRIGIAERRGLGEQAQDLRARAARLRIRRQDAMR